MVSRRYIAHPLFLALMATVVNLSKPVLVDDTAYLAFARHIATQPLQPYDFEMLWNEQPQPAMTILAPPVVPYWFAAGIAIFGESIPLLKLWLFPFVAIAAFAARSLLRRFAPAHETLGLVILTLGPSTLPFWNHMLDMPALGLELASLSLFLHSANRVRRMPILLLSGLCMALAIETKYSVLALPVILLFWGIAHKQYSATAIALTTGLLLFVAMEMFISLASGESHFLHHAWKRSANRNSQTSRVALVLPLFGHLGGAVGWIGFAIWANRRDYRVAVGTLAISALFVLVLPIDWVTIVAPRDTASDPLTIANVLFAVLGVSAMSAVLYRTASHMLVGWLVLEILAYFVLSPFPAGRRVLGVAFVMILIALQNLPPVLSQRARWTIRIALVWGLSFAAIDTFDAWVERDAARCVVDYAKAEHLVGTGYFDGRWGYQYYCERAGLKPYIPGQTILRKGDWIAVAEPIDGVRVRGIESRVTFDRGSYRCLAVIDWDDDLRFQTIPSLYGGKTPLALRMKPRLRIAIYLVILPAL